MYGLIIIIPRLIAVLTSPLSSAVALAIEYIEHRVMQFLDLSMWLGGGWEAE